MDGREKTLYEWKQTQRKLEREIRKESQIRDMAKEAGNNTLAKDCDFKINTYRKKYDDICGKIGLEPKYERMRTYSAKGLTISGNGGKINYRGLSAKMGGSNDTPEHDEPKLLGKIDYEDKTAVLNELEAYEKDAVKNEIETARVITKSGAIYECYGTRTEYFQIAI